MKFGLRKIDLALFLFGLMIGFVKIYFTNILSICKYLAPEMLYLHTFLFTVTLEF